MVEIVFRKLSDQHHRVTVRRSDGSTDAVELDSKDFLRHDLAHFAVEVEVGLERGVWGSVAYGGSLDGEGLDGVEVARAESLAGPMQTAMRVAAEPDAILVILRRLAPDIATPALAHRLHQRMRALAGHWAATGYGDDMALIWPYA